MAKSDIFLLTAAFLLLVIGVMRLDSVDLGLFNEVGTNRTASGANFGSSTSDADTARVSISTNTSPSTNLDASTAAQPNSANSVVENTATDNATDDTSDGTIIIEASSSARRLDSQGTVDQLATPETQRTVLADNPVQAPSTTANAGQSNSVVATIESTGSNSVGSTESVRLYMHTIKPGDSLSKLAIEFDTTVEELREINLLKDSVIHVGHTLLYPIRK